MLAFELADEYYQLMLRRAVGWGLLSSDVLPAPLPVVSDAEAAGDGPPLMRSGFYASGYQGVYKIGQRWVAKAMRDGSLKSLGAYGTAQEAARAYARECSVELGGRPDERPNPNPNPNPNPSPNPNPNPNQA